MARTNIQTLRSVMLRCFSVADCCYHDGSRNAYRQIDCVAIISVEVQKVPVARSRHRKNELVLKQTDSGNCNCLGQELDSKGVQPHLADAALLRALSITGIEFRYMMIMGRQSLGRSTRYEHEMKESNITWQVFGSEAPVLFGMECTRRAGFTLLMNVRQVS